MLPEAVASLAAEPAGYRRVHDGLDESIADALLTEREREVRRLVREICAEEVAPRAAQVDREHLFAGEGYRALATQGLAGLIVPRELGGTDDSHVAYAVAMEEITAACAATSLVYMTQMHTAYPIMLAGSPAVQERYVPGLVDGSLLGSLAITEPEAGSDVSSLRTTAEIAGDEYLVSGAKTFITTGDRSDVLVLFATTDRTAGRRGISALVVDGEAEGLGRGAPFRKMGMHGSTTSEVFLDRVRVPTGHRLGEPGDGWRIVMSSVIKSRVSAAAQGVGLARAAYARTLHVLQALHGPDWPADVEFAMASLRSRIVQGRLLLWTTAQEIDRRGEADTAHIAMMKQACTDLGWETSVATTGLLGELGDLRGLDVERCLRDAKVTQIYDGTNEIQRMLVGRDTRSRVTTMYRDGRDA